MNAYLRDTCIYDVEQEDYLRFFLNDILYHMHTDRDTAVVKAN